MEAAPGEPFRRILLVLLTPIGDTLFATPAIRVLRRAYPEAHIGALVWRANRAVLDNNPDVDEIVVLEPSVGVLRRLRRARYELAVHFAPFHDYLGPLLGIRRRLSLPVPWLFGLLPHANRRWQLAHARDHYLEVLRPLGLPIEDTRPVLKISGRQEAFAERFLADNGCRPGELLVGMHAGGIGFKGAKRWSPEGFAWVARQLGQPRLVFFGGAEDSQLSRSIVEAGVPDGYVDACGKLSLSEAIGLLARMDLFIGNDSGPLHLAAASGVPVVGIYGPTSVLAFHPLGDRVRAVYGPTPCPADYGFIGNRPLWRRGTCSGECLESVDPADVAAAAQELLASRTGSVILSPRAKNPLLRGTDSSRRSE